MFKTIKEAVSKIVIPVFLENGFVLGKDGCNTYYRKSENYLEIIYIGPTKYGNSYVVRVSIVYWSNNEKNNNIDYLRTFHYGITPFDKTLPIVKNKVYTGLGSRSVARIIY